ncbi:Valine--tRNA ligase [uncultured Eubacterium sp.]|uniref:valine--tRNA ligase n=1 Tax=Brotomerdimonas butyrica TaxID=2981721 RepID=UPI000821D55D|nr:valine--tRNA ligase [Brotomerdimonas butyrica]MCU6755446.1 valine--tRNA ligase [Brotomerdimonas butyrica]SCH30418.1 Valine--tRNA ligase [uncultured Eubacterium sp.]
MEKNLDKTYDPKKFEDRIYDMWEKNGAFRAECDPDKKPFTIVMPPPNITGQLHMGHALDQTLQDVLTRFKRLQGYSALWLPGSDHASIATEVKVVNRIREEEGLEKEDLGREEFLKRAWAWKKEFGGKITKQCRKLGDSCDWSRERFTMDEGCNKAVNHFFVRLYEKGLIYKGNRLINWCPECGTSLSDAEVEHEDKNGMYWYFRYPAADGGEGIIVATSRPETMFGDVAIAVHPSDERYKDMVGKNVILPLVGKEIPIIADPYPDPEKGTGAVKITPAHDPNDFEVGQRNDLENISCINPDATMNSLAGKYEGMDRYECRKAWVKDLEEAGYLVKTEEKVIPVGECYRCRTVVEPMLSDQWFVKMEELAKPAIEAAKSGALQHVPERFEKTYLHWLEEIRDWCISRQLWWGHRIPAYYCQDCGELMVAETAPHQCSKCGSTNIKQDEDVLDTWFSSALWPFSTLGWPEETEDLKYFYPTDVLVTGYDIIFFWVVRMVFSALETTGEVPFKYVYVHGLVRDAQGRKMSKSLGNGIDPLEIIDQYGADALRFMLTTGITPGNDMRFKTDKLESARNFANKLWNASRFVIMNLQDEDGSFREMAELTDLNSAALQDEDKWMISRVNDAVKYITETMEKFDLALAGQRAYDLIWNEFCDWYIEIVKGRLYGDDEQDKMVARAVLVKVLKDMLRLLHPFMPYITEEIWAYLPKEEASADNPDNFLIKESWPIYSEELAFPEETEKLEMAMAVIKSIRNIRAEADAAPSRKLTAVILCADGKEPVVRAGERYITKIANITDITFAASKADVPEEVMSAVVAGAEIFIPLDDIMDYEAELDRLRKEKKKLEGEVKRVVGKLSNEGFIKKAPEKVINEEKAKQVKYEEMLAKVCDRLAVVEKKVK